MSQLRRIFITGTNRGLGHGLVKLLQRDHPEFELHISSRHSPDELSQKWQAEFPEHSFHTYQMDITQHSQIAENVRKLKENNSSFNYIVANAAVGVDHGMKIPSGEVARKTLNTNVTATIDFVKQFLPLLSDDGRIIIVSAILGALKGHTEQFQAKVNNPALTEE